MSSSPTIPEALRRLASCVIDVASGEPEASASASVRAGRLIVQIDAGAFSAPEARPDGWDGVDSIPSQRCCCREAFIPLGADSVIIGDTRHRLLPCHVEDKSAEAKLGEAIEKLKSWRNGWATEYIDRIIADLSAPPDQEHPKAAVAEQTKRLAALEAVAKEATFALSELNSYVDKFRQDTDARAVRDRFRVAVHTLRVIDPSFGSFAPKADLDQLDAERKAGR